MKKTFSAKSEEIRREWHVIDAENMCLGRLCSKVAKVLMGKHKPIYTPHVDTGDFVVIINSDKVKVTGRKNNDKLYYRHTGFIGGIKSANFNWMLQNKPTEIIMLAVKGMLPKNSLGRAMLRKLKVFAGSKHTHSAQQPKVLAI